MEEYFGAKVKALRKQKGFEQQECADRVAAYIGEPFSRSGWAKMENSLFRNVHMDKVLRVAAGLQISEDEAKRLAGLATDITEDSIEKHVGRSIASCRILSGYDVMQVAAVIGVSQSQYKDIEEGKSVCSYITMYQLASLFDVSISQLYGEVTPVPGRASSQLADMKDDIDTIHQLLLELKGTG